MGSDAEVYVFDSGRFNDVVVPFVRKLIRFGGAGQGLFEHSPAVQPYLEAVAGILAGYRADLKRTDLDTYCTYLGKDLRFPQQDKDLAGVKPDREWAWSRWDQRACQKTDCPVSGTCPFHISDAQQQIEGVNEVFCVLTKVLCLGRSQFVGRSVNVFFYKDVLEKNGVTWESELWNLLLALGTRGSVVGYGFSNSDGIHGWLTPAETERLLTLLKQVRLPELKPSFRAMEWTRHWIGGYRMKGWEFDELSLAFVRTVSAIALQQGKGILWGNDVHGDFDRVT